MPVAIDLKCPGCGAANSLDFQPNLISPTLCRCGQCDATPEVHGGVVDLAPGLSAGGAGDSLVQRLLNTRLFAGLYETPIWRPFLTWLGSGEPAEQEMTDVLSFLDGLSPRVVADLCCGTGHYTRALGERFPSARVYGLDISPGMLARAQVVARQQGPSHLQFIRGNAYHLPLADASVDVINNCGALHLFPDLKPIWAEIYRVLKPGGIFTAMSIALAPGPMRKVQTNMMERGKATFFDPQHLGRELAEHGLDQFEFLQKRVSLVWRAQKQGERVTG